MKPLNVLIAITCLAVLVFIGNELRQRYEDTPQYVGPVANEIATTAAINGTTFQQEIGNAFCFPKTVNFKRQTSCIGNPGTSEYEKAVAAADAATTDASAMIAAEVAAAEAAATAAAQ